MRELTSVMNDIEARSPTPHLLLGDFNSMSTGDPVAATRFFRRYNELRRAGLVIPLGRGYMGPVPRDSADGAELDARWRDAGIDPRLDVGVPHLPQIVGRVTRGLPVSSALDRFLGGFIERWTADRIARLGYIDCYRRLHPRAHGYTCATWLPAARIDYIFATADVARHLVACDVVGGRSWPDPEASLASDHFPLVADFAF